MHIEIQKYVQIRDYGLYWQFQALEVKRLTSASSFQKLLDLEMLVKSSLLYLNYHLKISLPVEHLLRQCICVYIFVCRPEVVQAYAF